jgi:signal transduction histidine kinase
MSRPWYLLWPAAIVVGLAAEWTIGRTLEPRAAVLDLLTGWTIVTCGMLAWRQQPESRSGALLVACGFAWFAANFAPSVRGLADQWPPLATVAAALVYLHRGFLMHAIVTYPTGRIGSRLGGATVMLGYAACFVPAIWRSNGLTVAAMAGFAVATWTITDRASRDGATAARLARLAALGLSAVLVTGSIARFVDPTVEVVGFSLFAYEVSLVAVSIGLSLGLRSRAPDRKAVTDLVVELGETRSGSLRDGLATVLGDPDLQVGYWIPDRSAYVDTEGNPIALPDGSAGQVVTSVERDGLPVAAVIHDPAVLDDPRIVGAIADAARLAASNAALHARVRAQVVELDSSRLRLVAVGEEERRGIERRLQHGAVRRLHAIEGLLDAWRASSSGSPAAISRVTAAGSELSAALHEIEELARGLRPRSLSEHGLATALTELAARSSVAVAGSVPPKRWPSEIEATAYYVCAEALANVAKHALATTVDVTLSEEGGWLRIAIRDDGVGGADPERGTGLQGLRDRVEAMGGRLSIDSQPGQGTRLVALLPLSDEASQTS